MSLFKWMKLRRYKKHARANIKEIKKILAKNSSKIDPKQVDSIYSEIDELKSFIKQCSEPQQLEDRFIDFSNRTDKVLRAYKKSVFREYAEAIITAILLALLIRNFVVQAFKIPTGSMQPTLHGANYYGVGDRILVNKFIYGAKTPTGILFTDIKIPYYTFRELRKPQRGDVIVFSTEDIALLDEDERKKDFIKRLVGLPGDKIEILGLRRETLFVQCDFCGEIKHIVNPIKIFKPNGEIFLQGECATCRKILTNGPIGEKEGVVLVNDKVLDTPEIFKRIPYLNEGPFGGRFKTIYVPENSYYVLGDNSPSSKDSRFWGYVPSSNLKGLAFMIYWPLQRLGLIK